MTKILSGTELVGFIKERQARQVRALRQADHIYPRLAIIKSPEASAIIDVYVRMKQQYGEDILIDTVVETVPESEMIATISRLNADISIHGIIVQLPLSTGALTEEIVNTLSPEKDVDGLGSDAVYDSATAVAVNWLLASYGIELKNKSITIIGNGRLVGAPLARIWRESGLHPTVLDITSENMKDVVSASQIIVTATGVPHLVTSDMVSVDAVIVDAGTASEGGMIVGDVDPAVRERSDVTITPEKGGVGPLTIAMLFDHVIQSAERVARLAK
jgi:methylenetetrahydrofolate dehydrogenase (NADP+)/methenyltetrahydrofolate cyclohydrolase